MKRKSVQYFLLIMMVIGGYNTYGQSDKSYLISDNQQNFINNLINPKKSKPSVIKIANNQSFSFKLNVQNQTDQDLTLIGTVNNHSLSSFSFTKTNNSLKGNIILHDLKKAYTLYSKSNGQVYVKEADINTILCVDFEKANTKDIDPGTTFSKAAPQLESLPGAPGIIYLDFDGELVSNTSWLGGATIDAQSPNFSDEKIIKVWKIMAEDFRPFNLNVTTRRDLFDAAPKNRRMMCIFTTTKDAAPDSGGVAYLNSFSSNSNNPCWVYNLGTRSAGETGSHEVGHTLGLSHDGKPGTTYYSGHGEWSPIMGWSANKTLGHWSSGEYPDATNTQDDIAIISNNRNGVGFQNDDHGNTFNEATAIKVAPSGAVSADQNFGLISTREDKDVFSFAVETGNVSLSFDPDPDYPNLNIQVRILNELGQEVALSDPNGLTASINQNLTEGIYYIEIDGVGEGTLANGYSDYSSLGNYSISGNYIPGDDKQPPLSDFEATTNCSVVEFQSTSTNRISSYLWNFGDGQTSTEQNPTHTYTTNGNYTVSLTTTNDSGNNTKEKSDFISINLPNLPVVTNQNVCAGESVTITISGNSEYKWYTTATGGTSIASGLSYGTPALDATQTYYIEGAIGNCTTTTRTEVKAIVSENPEEPAIAVNQNHMLFVPSQFSSYQWYYKDEPIDDANQAEYLPTEVGEHIIKVSNEAGCSITSKAFEVDQSLLNLGQENKTFTYYPNPVNDDEILHIDGITINDHSVRIVNIQGQVLIDTAPTPEMDISELSHGLYIILINNKPLGKFVRQ
ncbi:PKD domain-containing protein [Aquimarina sp. AU58]|uniref:PKD domain-containing protein n=1 Tax=Aquimarina sp. AU58 TaxID=1874112 RepID=UPI000D64A27A|nr:PKD domain-containing protein [Aquimarina sp. AU58]